MQYIVLLFLFQVLALIEASKSRSVNVAVETVLEFDGKDDVEFIDTLQNFLRKLKSTVTKQRADNSQDSKHLDDVKEENDKFIFTDFLAETASVLKTYDDDDLKKFFRTLDRELKKFETRKEFHDVTEKLRFRRLVEEHVEKLTKAPVDDIRRKLNFLSEKFNTNKRDGNKGFVGDVLNNFYKRQSKTKLMSFLNNLKLYRSNRRRNLEDLKNIIRSGITTIIEPFLKLNSESLFDIDSLYFKYIAEYSDPKPIEKYTFENVLKNDSKPLIARQRKKSHKVSKEYDLLDYIEDHKKIIGKHFTRKGVAIKAKLKSKPKPFKTTNTIYKRIPATRSKNKRKIKNKHNNLSRAIINPFQMSIKYTTKKVEDQKPVLIKLGSSEVKELSSEEEYVYSTSKQPIKQKRHKKSTRSKVTTKKRNILKISTKKSRKAFKTTTSSAEGLSIEHFGSLFGREFHGKRHDTDIFVLTGTNSTLSTAPYDLTSRNGSNIFKKAGRRKGDLSIETAEYNLEKHDDIKNSTGNIEGNTTVTNTRHLNKNNNLENSIQIRGNIVIENPTKITHHKVEKERTSPSSVYDSTTGRNYNVSIVTTYVNFKTTDPNFNLRHQDTEISNKITTTPFEIKTMLTSPETKNVNAIELEMGKMNTKAVGDDLENEIEDIMDKYNASTIPMEYQKFIKEVENDDKENDKVKEQMKADLAKLMAPPTTKSTVTELFTDPFDGVDNDDLF